ncbi:MAG: cytochrome c-type biogenesis protein CcmH [Thermodesulfobacteriota bacterium]|jgi:cytochrome c-type biogenesis protein CcmH
MWQTRRAFLVTGLRIAQAGLGTLLATVRPSRGDAQQTEAQPDALVLEQERLAQRIEGKLIAPCCFAQTVANHYSDVAEQIKKQIRRRLAQGATEEEIINEYVRVYGERILAEPQARGFNLLAYLLPPLAIVGGLGSVCLFLRQWRPSDVHDRASVHTPTVHGQGATDPLRARLSEELARFHV